MHGWLVQVELLGAWFLEVAQHQLVYSLAIYHGQLDGKNLVELSLHQMFTYNLLMILHAINHGP